MATIFGFVVIIKNYLWPIEMQWSSLCLQSNSKCGECPFAFNLSENNTNSIFQREGGQKLYLKFIDVCENENVQNDNEELLGREKKFPI
jgi:hypothetical protein